jgi:hypothetical protein
MSTIMLSARCIAVVAVVTLGAGSQATNAADLGVAPLRSAGAWCGPCGCLRVSYNYHRDLRSTYGIGFDPRTYDQTEPHYFHGAVRAYPRYWVCGDPLQ